VTASTLKPPARVRTYYNLPEKKLSLWKTANSRLPHCKCAREAPGLAGDAETVVAGFFAEGTNGEEFVAAWDAPVCRHAQKALERRKKARDVFRRDAPEILVAADGTVSGEFAGNRSEAGAEARSAARAPPRQAADESGGEVQESASARAAAARRTAGGANQHGWVVL
jgi:hypothetical protein